MGGFGIQNLLTVGGEGGSKKVKMLTVVDGRMVGRVERENIKVLLLTIGGGEGGLKKTKLLTVVDGREGGWVKILKIVDGC